jgi:hypothetical protein
VLAGRILFAAIFLFGASHHFSHQSIAYSAPWSPAGRDLGSFLRSACAVGWIKGWARLSSQTGSLAPGCILDPGHAEDAQLLGD